MLEHLQSDPALSAVITASGQSIEGQSYSLTCEVVGDESLAVSNRLLRWDKDGVETSRNPTLTFNPLSPSDAAEYMCTSNFLSPYFTESRTVTTTVTVTVHGQLLANRCFVCLFDCLFFWEGACFSPYKNTFKEFRSKLTDQHVTSFIVIITVAKQQSTYMVNIACLLYTSPSPRDS